MKKTALLLFTFCLCAVANAQNTFEKVIDTLGCNEAKCVQQTFDGGYIVCGTTYHGNNDAAIIKLDSLGNIQWVKTYGGNGMDGAIKIEQLPDSGYIVTGIWNYGLNSNNWLLRLNSIGDTLWTQKLSLGSDNTVANGSKKYGSSNMAITGNYENASSHVDTYFLKTDSLGNIINSKIYNFGGFGSEGHDIITTYNNGFAIVGVYGPNASSSVVMLYRIDSIGDTLWTNTYAKTYANSGNAIQQTPDSGFIIAGITLNTSNLNYDVYLIKTDANGDTLWTKVIFYPYGNTPSAVEQIKSGNYVIAGRIVDTLPQIIGKLLLIKTDTVGDTVWTRHYAGVNSAQGFYVR